MADAAPKLDYIKRDAERPIRTRIDVEERPDVTRFIDPPASSSFQYHLAMASLPIACAVGTLLIVGPTRASLKHDWVALVVVIVFLWAAGTFVAMAIQFLT